jgi:predicted Zn-dependent protease
MIRQRPTIAHVCLILLVAVPMACTSSDRQADDMAAQAQQLFDSGQPVQALDLIGRSIRERDDQPASYLLQAKIALALGNREDAYRAYANAQSLEAANPEALLGVAQIGVGLGHLSEADAAADKILVLDPNQNQALLVKGIVKMVRNDLDGAIGFSDKILAITPGDVTATILKARALALRGDRNAALGLIRGGIAKAGETRELAMSLVELQRFGGDANAFLASLRRIRQLAPENRDYRFDLVDTLYRLGHTDEARAEAASLIAEPTLTADEASRFARLFNAYDRNGLTAEQITRAATKASVDTRLALARFYIGSGRADAAITLLRPLATGWSSDIQALYARAIGAAGNSVAATTAANNILKRDLGNGDALLIRAANAMARHEPAAAIVDYQRVIRDYPKWEEGYIGLARAYAASDRADGVRRAFEDGRKALPQSLPLARDYSAMLLQMGDKEHAVEVARRFALDSPSLVTAWSLYATICARTGGEECRTEAAEGFKQARSRYGLDPAPGTPPPIALIGRLN